VEKFEFDDAQLINSNILRCMRLTLKIDAELLRRASELTGIADVSALVRAGLTALIERESARRLADLGGTMPTIETVRRRR